MQSLFHFQNLAEEMVAADAERDRMLSAMDAMWRNQWSLPPNVAGLKWIHKVVSSDPHDAVRAGTRLLSSVAPQLSVQPLGAGPAARTRAEQIERALAWHFRNAGRRRQAGVLRDVVLSALLYDEVVAQVVYLPEQQGAAGLLGGRRGTARGRAAARFGPFAILVRNPQQVHVRYSDWMPEAVLMKTVLRMQDVADFWGVRAKALAAAPKRGRGGNKPAQLTHCTLYDYMDLEQRAVWAVPQAGGLGLAAPGGGTEADAVEILREPHGLGFLPWAAKVGGTTLAESGGPQRIPLLYSVYTSGQWETQNIVETLLTSEVIAYAAAPRMKIEGPSDGVDVDYGEPGRPAYVPPGHKLDALQPPGMDQGLAAMAQRAAERISKSTVPRVLQSGDYPSGTGYATLNLATQSGMKTLAPYKELAEEALGEVFGLMLAWLQHSGQPLEGRDGRRGRGEPIRIQPGELAGLAVDVELTADVPTDRMARINAASMAVRDLGYSRQRALEQIGESDPHEVLRQAAAEQLAAVELEIEKARLLAMAGLAPAATAPRPAQGGQGFNPALGGEPAVTADPDLALREG
ncbi:MAG: hypothetical protein KIT46_08225 [Anaerolineales bacterium]|nr:hypothetical protein [Anaerolineales bacterium]MCW5856016.1 hypothetical protein [Anaerolineales bacterium]